MQLNSLQKQKHDSLIHTFKDTVVNRTLSFLGHFEGHLRFQSLLLHIVFNYYESSLTFLKKFQNSLKVEIVLILKVFCL